MPWQTGKERAKIRELKQTQPQRQRPKTVGFNVMSHETIRNDDF